MAGFTLGIVSSLLMLMILLVTEYDMFNGLAPYIKHLKLLNTIISIIKALFRI